MKRKISLLLCIVMILSMMFSLTGCFAENDYARIVDVDYTAKVVDTPGSDGKVVVTERITFDVHAASKWNGFWELWRDLVERWVDGVRVYYDVKSVKQILSNGKEILWEESPKLYWDDFDYVSENPTYGPNKWYHSPGPYNEAARMYECLLLYVDNLYRGVYTFEIEYEMYNAVLRYGDSSDIYIPMYSGEGLKYLESFNGQILIPTEKMPSDGNYKVVTYGTKGGDFPIKESATMNPGYYTFYFNLDEKDLKFTPDTEFIEFDLVSYGEDKHSFSTYASVNDYYNDDVLDEIFRTQSRFFLSVKLVSALKVVLFLACVLLAYIIVKKAMNKTKNLDKKFNNKVITDDNITFRDIPSDLDPNFAASFVFCKSFKNAKEDGIYSAILLSLARKKYVDIKEKSATNVIISLLEPETPELEPIAVFKDGDFDWYNPKPTDPREPLTVSEELYLNLLKRHAKKGSISLDALQNRVFYDSDYTNNFSKKMKKSVMETGINSNYFKNSNYLGSRTELSNLSGKLLSWGVILLIACYMISKTAIQFAFGGIPLLVLACFYGSYYLKRMSRKYVVLTDFGEEEYKKWRGLYNFLNSDTLINEKRVVELPLWEKYLVYATAFGISEKVIDAIKLRCNDINISGSTGSYRYSSGYTSPSIIHNSYCSSGRIRSYGSTFHSSIRSGSFSHSSSFGSSSFGGSYHSGGRGGGYGGGGH